jgi:hypothetical protein
MLAAACLASCTVDIAACGLGYRSVEAVCRRDGAAWAPVESGGFRQYDDEWSYLEHRAQGDVAIVVSGNGGSGQAMVMSASGEAGGQYVWMSPEFMANGRDVHVDSHTDERISMVIGIPVERTGLRYLAIEPSVLRCAVVAGGRALPSEARVLSCGSVLVSIRDLRAPLEAVDVSVDIALRGVAWSGFRRITPSQLGDLLTQSRWSMVGVTMERWSRLSR